MRNIILSIYVYLFFIHCNTGLAQHSASKDIQSQIQQYKKSANYEKDSNYVLLLNQLAYTYERTYSFPHQEL